VLVSIVWVQRLKQSHRFAAIIVTPIQAVGKIIIFTKDNKIKF